MIFIISLKTYCFSFEIAFWFWQGSLISYSGESVVGTSITCEWIARPPVSTALVKSYSRCWAVMNNFQIPSGPRWREPCPFFLASPALFYRALSLCTRGRNSSALLSTALPLSSSIFSLIIFFLSPETSRPPGKIFCPKNQYSSSKMDLESDEDRNPWQIYIQKIPNFYSEK